MDLKFLKAYYAYLSFILCTVLAQVLLGHTGLVIILGCVTTVLIYDAYMYKKELDVALKQLQKMSDDIKTIHQIEMSEQQMSEQQKDELK